MQCVPGLRDVVNDCNVRFIPLYGFQCFSQCS
uniref:Uncharacterized protein n=1 Tax=Anguilla anguilla TaxID=7936 RepID=A0A0E9QSF3_ANGAN